MGEVTQEFKSGNALKSDEISITGKYPVYGGNGLRGYTLNYNHDGEFALIGRQGALCGNMNYSAGKAYFTEHAVVVEADSNNNTRFLYYMLNTMNLGQYSDQSAQPGLAVNKLIKLKNFFPEKSEQIKIGAYFSNLDHLITLHQRKYNELKKLKKYMQENMFPQKGQTDMSELESVIEKRLIEQLCSGESQWTYRPDLKTEEDLWNNFKYILEQNNKAKLDDVPLSESEFAKIKNDLSHASFYDAGKWLVGENGKVYVHVQRGNETLHLVVMNNEHVAGGSSVYEVINQYQAFKDETDEKGRDRRFDVSLLINGIPMIHIELKNRDHSYIDGYRQIQKYIAEGKFHGIFSNVQMFVVSNAVDTKYFSAARDTEKKFLTGWIDNENQPVCDYIDFAKAVLRIPEAHEMVTKYIVLDNDKKKLLILRPYQIHAIEAMRAASKAGKSGYIWHTTGSGKTMTSYKATRNLLMDIPSIQKTIFLIDRKDLDLQTKGAFQSYADNDTIDVDDTEHVGSLIKKLADDNRQMIVTTRQKMQVMINRRLKEGTKEYDKIKALKVAFVVDECHRAVTPQTKRDIDDFLVTHFGLVLQERLYLKKISMNRKVIFRRLRKNCMDLVFIVIR